MNKIETERDLMQWSREVNTVLNNKICDYQDIFARSNIKDLKDLFIITASNKNDFNLVIFSIQKAMGSEVIADFMRYYAKCKAEDYIADEMKSIETRWTEILQHEKDFELKKEQLKATIKNLEHRNEELKKDNANMTKTMSDMSIHTMDLKDEICELQSTIDELNIFKKHVKELMAK